MLFAGAGQRTGRADAFAFAERKFGPVGDERSVWFDVGVFDHVGVVHGVTYFGLDQIAVERVLFDRMCARLGETVRAAVSRVVVRVGHARHGTVPANRRFVVGRIVVRVDGLVVGRVCLSCCCDGTSRTIAVAHRLVESVDFSLNRFEVAVEFAGYFAHHHEIFVAVAQFLLNELYYIVRRRYVLKNISLIIFNILEEIFGHQNNITTQFCKLVNTKYKLVTLEPRIVTQKN